MSQYLLIEILQNSDFISILCSLSILLGASIAITLYFFRFFELVIGTVIDVFVKLFKYTNSKFKMKRSKKL